MTATDRDLRFDTPLYTLAEAARLLDVPSVTFASWRTDYLDRDSEGRASYVPALTTHRSLVGPSVPFIALAEGMVLAAIHKTGVPMLRIRPVLIALREEIGLDHALASRDFYSDGAEILDHFGGQGAEPNVAQLTKQLVVVRSGQRVFTDIVSEHLGRIEYAEDGYAKLVRLPGYRRRQVIVDPARAFGQPVFARGAAKVSDVVGRFRAGESLAELSEDYGIPLDDLVGAINDAEPLRAVRAPSSVRSHSIAAQQTSSSSSSRSCVRCSVATGHRTPGSAHAGDPSEQNRSGGHGRG